MVLVRPSLQSRLPQRNEEVRRVVVGPIRRACAQNRYDFRATTTPILQIVRLIPLRPKCCVDCRALFNRTPCDADPRLRVGLSHELVALTEIRISCRGENRSATNRVDRLFVLRRDRVVQQTLGDADARPASRV